MVTSWPSSAAPGVRDAGRRNIVLKGLHKAYRGRAVVRGVSLNVRQGEVVGLLGANGAGKTTTFYMVVGLVHADSGQVVLEGSGPDEVNLTPLPFHERARHGVGYLPQEMSIFRKLNVEDNLRLIWQVRGLSAEEQERRLNVLLAEFSIAPLRKYMAYTLSGGERRRVEIARAIATEPSFLLLDEPFTGVDPIAVAELQDIIKRLRDRGLGILITDHNVRETLQITDRTYIIREGEILVSGTARDIAESPIARKYYLGERFSMAGTLADADGDSPVNPAPEPVPSPPSKPPLRRATDKLPGVPSPEEFGDEQHPERRLADTPPSTSDGAGAA
jgi:lipopolysaccharide export system ATP-binding protein